MKKGIGLFILAILAITTFAQAPKGVDYSKAMDFEYADYETLLKGENESYIYIYRHNAVGYKHAVEKIFYLCNENSLDASAPSADNSLLPSYAESWMDYSSVITSCLVGSAEIAKMWIVNENWMITLNVDAENIFVMIFKGLEPRHYIGM